MIEFMRQYGWLMLLLGVAMAAGLHFFVMKLLASADKQTPPNSDKPS